MINKILTNNTISNTISFKALTRQEETKIDAKIYKESSKEQWYTNSESALIGLGVGIIAKLTKAKEPVNKGIAAYFGSYFLLSAINGLKNRKNYKEKYLQYEKEYNYKNGFERFLGKFAVPKPLDLGNENKNKEYYKTYKDKYMFGAKLITNSAIATGLTAFVTNIICNAKKISDKNWIVGNAAYISLLASLGIGFVINKINESKDQNIQK